MVHRLSEVLTAAPEWHLSYLKSMIAVAQPAPQLPAAVAQAVAAVAQKVLETLQETVYYTVYYTSMSETVYEALQKICRANNDRVKVILQF